MPNISLCKSLFDAIGVITQCFLWKNGTIKRGGKKTECKGTSGTVLGKSIKKNQCVSLTALFSTLVAFS